MVDSEKVVVSLLSDSPDHDGTFQRSFTTQTNIVKATTSFEVERK